MSLPPIIGNYRYYYSNFRLTYVPTPLFSFFSFANTNVDQSFDSFRDQIDPMRLSLIRTVRQRWPAEVPECFDASAHVSEETLNLCFYSHHDSQALPWI